MIIALGEAYSGVFSVGLRRSVDALKSNLCRPRILCGMSYMKRAKPNTTGSGECH